MISRLLSLLSPWRSPDRWRDRDLGKPVADWFLSTADRHAKRPAVRCEGRDLTYGELRGKAENLARELNRVHASGPVAVCCGQNEYAVIAIVGILLAGRTTVFLSPDDPLARRQRILEVSRVRFVVVESPSVWPEDSDPGMSLIDLASLPVTVSAHEPLPVPDASADLALVFTSGQTGQPSGVRYAQRSQLHTVRHLARRCGIAPEDRIALTTSLNFGNAWNDLFLALLSGACLYPFSPTRNGGNRLAEWLGKESISYFHCVPSIFRTIAREDTVGLARLTALRWLRLGGEPCRQSDFQLLRDRFPSSISVLLSYGITEVSGIIADRVLTSGSEIPADSGQDSVLSMGRPIPSRMRPFSWGEKSMERLETDFRTGLPRATPAGEPIGISRAFFSLKPTTSQVSG